MSTTGDDFSLDDFRLDVEAELPHRRERRSRRPKSDWFLRGPIPGDWLERAASLPGKALNVGLAVWHLSALKKRKSVRLSSQALTRFAVTPTATYRALRALEQARLVQVERHKGRRPIVRILHADTE